MTWEQLAAYAAAEWVPRASIGIPTVDSAPLRSYRHSHDRSDFKNQRPA